MNDGKEMAKKQEMKEVMEIGWQLVRVIKFKFEFALNTQQLESYPIITVYFVILIYLNILFF